MAFFPRNFYNTSNDASFTPLFRLLDDFDSYSRQGGNCNGRRTQAVPTWQPKFDIRETADAYELHGELPGMVKENIHIEFTEPQTILVRGRTERTYTAGSSPAGAIEDTSAVSASISEAGEERRNSHQATVEDEEEDVTIATKEAGWEDVSARKTNEENALEQQLPVDKAKYWLTERNIGEFSRSFNFPGRVEQDSVSASLKDGILTLSVPKAKKHEARPIAIN